ncbi:MAG TPA: acyl carrier protein [Thermoanaerobaculia bacterium]|nr:acyl carrier protein [Thermoanaerobaculia bacterium]
MGRTDILHEILTALGAVAPEADLSNLDPAEPIRGQLDLDSIDFLNFVVSLHERLGVDVPEADYGELASVDGALAYLTARRS